MANQYSQRNIETLELLYGEGYLSMGGDDEVASIVAPASVTGKAVLDVGCGLGGAAIALLRNHGAQRVHGIDIDAGVLERASELVTRNGLRGRITLTRFAPGPLPLADDSFDLVYMTAVSCHVENLVPFFSEIKRVIKCGGCLVGGEWFIKQDNAAYRRWDQLLRERGLDFYFVSHEALVAALDQSGFEQVAFSDQTRRMAGLAQTYLDRSENELEDRFLNTMGADGYAEFLEWTRVRAEGLAGEGSGYGHFYATIGNPAGKPS